jgi:group I intron endonuclease
MYYVYKITNKINDKVYIGKTNNSKKRWQFHLWMSSLDIKKPGYSVIHAAINKYDKNNFTFEIIETCLTEQDAFIKERYWINELKSNINKFGNEYGYNLTDGGEGQSGFKHSKETVKQISRLKKLDCNLRGVQNPKAILNIEIVSNIKQLLMEGVRTQIICDQFKISPFLVSQIRLGETWEYVNPHHTLFPKIYGRGSLMASILVESNIPIIRKLLQDGISQTKIAKQFNVSQRTISDIKTGKTWKHI